MCYTGTRKTESRLEILGNRTALVERRKPRENQNGLTQNLKEPQKGSYACICSFFSSLLAERL